MDETAKPLRIPPEMAIYAEKHEIFDLVQVNIFSISFDNNIAKVPTSFTHHLTSLVSDLFVLSCQRPVMPKQICNLTRGSTAATGSDSL